MAAARRTIAFAHDEASDSDNELVLEKPVDVAPQIFSDDEDIFPEEGDRETKQDERLQRALMRDGDKRTRRDIATILDALNTMRDEFIMNLSEPVKEALCSRFMLEEFDSGERVFEYGSLGSKMYLIWTGRVSIEVPRSHHASSSQIVNPEHVDLIPLTRLDPGRAFGELALISETKTRAARVTAVKRTLLMVLTEEDYKWGVGFAQGSFVKDRVHFLRSVDRAVLEDVSEVDLRAMAGHLRMESHIGDHEILKQGEEVDRIIFVKSGFCKVVRQLHPRFKKTFDDYAEKGLPPPNPFADNEEEEPSMPLLPKLGNTDPAEGVDEALALDFGLGGRHALQKLMSKYHGHEVDDTGSRRGKPTAAAAMPSPRQSAQTKSAGATSSSAPASESVAGAPPAGGNDSADNMVVLDILRAGQSFGVMEMMEGFMYQSSVIANPLAEVFVMTKYDLIRNTSKAILHKLFCDYKTRLSDERLVHRLKQKSRWNSYKRDLWDQIQERKTSGMQRHCIDRRTVNRRTGASNLSHEDYERVGTGDLLWDRRAQTPPKPTYNHKRDKEYVFHVHCYRTPGKKTPDVVVEHDARDESLAALEEKILMTIATARFRDQFRRVGGAELTTEVPDQLGMISSERDLEEEDQQEQEPDSPTESLPPIGGQKPKGQLAKHARVVMLQKEVLRAVTPVQRTAKQEKQALEDRAQLAAQEYVEMRKAHIGALQKAGKARAAPPQARKSIARPRASRGSISLAKTGSTSKLHRRSQSDVRSSISSQSTALGSRKSKGRNSHLVA